MAGVTVSNVMGDVATKLRYSKRAREWENSLKE